MPKTKSIAQLFAQPRVRVLVEDLEDCINTAHDLGLVGLENLLHCARAALPLNTEGQTLCNAIALEMLHTLEPMLQEWKDRTNGKPVLH